MHWPSCLIVTVVPVVMNTVLFQWQIVVAFLFVAADIAIVALHHLILHVCTNQGQVLQIFFHERLLSGELAELLAVLINHIKSSIEHGYFLSQLLLAQLIACAMAALTFIE